MTKEEIITIRREWGQWKRRMLSKSERKNLCWGMFYDFLYSKGYQITGLPILK